MEDPKNDEDNDAVIAAFSQAAADVRRKPAAGRIPKKPNVNRTAHKEVWSNGYVTWDEEEFKSRVRVHRKTFELILNEIGPLIIKTPTKFQPNPIEPHRQSGRTLYRLAHGCSYQTIEDLFAVSKSLASVTFNLITRVLVAELYELYYKVTTILVCTMCALYNKVTTILVCTMCALYYKVTTILVCTMCALYYKVTTILVCTMCALYYKVTTIQ